MNNECETYKLRILNFLNGNLDPKQAASVEQHIESCAECKQLVKDMGVIPFLTILDDSRREKTVAQVTTVIERELKSLKVATATEPNPVSDDRLAPELKRTRERKFWNFQFALPISAFALAALVLLLFSLGIPSYFSDIPSQAGLEIAKAPKPEELLAAPWIPMSRLEETDHIFAPHEQSVQAGGLDSLMGFRTPTSATQRIYESLQGIHSFNSSVSPSISDTDRLSNYLREFSHRVFAVMPLVQDSHSATTAVLLDKDREVLLCLDSVPDQVMLRSVRVSDVKPVSYLNNDIVCLAHTISRDENSGFTLLFAPGIMQMVMAKKELLPLSQFLQEPQATTETVAVSFANLTDEATQTLLQGKDDVFLKMAFVEINIMHQNDKDTTALLSEALPKDFPQRVPLFSLDGMYLIGTLAGAPEDEQTHPIYLKESIEKFVGDASPLIARMQEEYSSWQGASRALGESLEHGSLKQPLFGSFPGTISLHPLPEKKYIITIDMNNDGDDDFAIHSEYSGLLVSITGAPVDGQREKWLKELLSNITR